MAPTTKLVLSLHNGKSAQPLQASQPNLVQARAGEQYRVLSDVDGQARPARDVLAKRHGNDLKLDYADGTEVVLQDYYVACKGANACAALLPGADGASHAIVDTGAGAPLADGDTLVYAYGNHDTLLGMAQGDAGLGAMLSSYQGSEIGYAAGSMSSGQSGAAGNTGSGGAAAAPGSGISAFSTLGYLAGGAFVTAAASGISGGHSISNAPGGASAGTPVSSEGHHVVSGLVATGPVIAGNDLTVNVFQADGTTQIGTAKVDDTGHYRVDLGGYTGIVIARLANGTVPDYVDATTGQARNLSANLMAVGSLAGDALTLNVTPLTTVAALNAGAAYAGVSATSLTERTISENNTGVAAAFGLADVTGGDIVFTVTSTGAANPNFTPAELSAAEKYGAVLAALSGIDATNSDNMQPTVDSLLAGVLGTGSGAVVGAGFADVLMSGSGTAAARFGTNALPLAVSDLLSRGGSTITIDNVAGDNIIGATETRTTLTGKVAAGATVNLSIAGIDHVATVTGTTWSYALTPADLAAMGQGGETVAPTATLADGTIASARRSIVIDTIAPAAIISEDAPDAGPVLITFTFSEPVSGFDASDITLSAGATKGAFTALSATKYTLAVNPGPAGAESLLVSMAAGAARDVLGNDSKAVSSADFGFNSTIKLSSIAAGKDGFLIRGESSADLSGYSVSTAGDVNGDGLADLIVSARDNDANGTDTGRAYIVFGKTDHNAVNLSDIVAGKGGFVINGATGPQTATSSTPVGYQLGTSVSAVGDLNGDGLADLLVGAPTTGAATGRAFVVFGKTDTSAVNTASMATTAGYQYNGISTSTFGAAFIGLGDVNGDGLNDMVVGMPGYDTNTTTLKDNGRIIVVFGSPASQTGGTTLPNSGSTFTFGYTGASASDAIGGSPASDTAGGSSLAAAGDFNGDGLADLIVGVGDADPNGANAAGRAYVVYGRTNVVPPGGTTTTNNTGLSDVSKGLGGFAIDGVAAGDFFGASSAGVGDVNGDGLADLLIGARGTDVDGRPDAGRSYVVFGRAGTTTSVNLSDLANGAGGFVINGQCAGDASGWKVAAAGDINGDGLADMLVAANRGDTAGGADAGRTYVVFGTTSTARSSCRAVALGHGGFVIDGAAGTDQSGASVAAGGDINGDGFADLIVSATQADPNGLANAGASYVIFGAPTVLFGSTADQVAGSGRATLTGTAAGETLVGDAAANTLIGNGGADVLYGGAGNDTFVLNAGNVAALSSRFGSGGNADQLARVDGGAGIDTLQLSGAGITLDLGAVANIGPVGGINMSRLSSVEKIDLTGSGNNVLKLTLADVVDMAGMNSFNSGNGWTGLAAIEARHQVIVDGNAGDQVMGSGWLDTGKTASFGGHTYEVYTQGAYAELLVDTQVTRVLA